MTTHRPLSPCETDVAAWTGLLGDDLHRPERPDRDPPPGTRWVRCSKRHMGCADRWEPVDLGVADIVEALQGAVPTSGCCDGHGRDLPTILLGDGSTLVLLPPGMSVPVDRSVAVTERMNALLGLLRAATGAPRGMSHEKVIELVVERLAERAQK